ncbi:ArsR family transcriptional regulator OS=Streptomyces alboniger OX=132473 GN=CP975_34895 PE=4 SV=1 [Streptomyces alboniger]
MLIEGRWATGETVLRIHFTGRDLASICLAQRPDPLWEIVCSLCRLQTREGAVTFGPWRTAARDRARRSEPVRAAVTALRTLVPRAAYFPDFLTPSVGNKPCDLASGIDRVLMTPRHRLRHELSLLAAGGGKPQSGTELARGDITALTELGDNLRTYHQQLIAPLWNRIGAAVAADTALRTRALADGGIRALFGSLRPMAVWEPPVLTVDYPIDRDLFLYGRGLLLVPSYFCWKRPITLAEDHLQPVLIYPVAKPPASSVASRASLTRLLGSARAALLHGLAARACASTSEVADATGLSLPSVSQQLAILRDGGLVASRRDGKRVLHAVTPLGRRVLNGL